MEVLFENVVYDGEHMTLVQCMGCGEKIIEKDKESLDNDEKATRI